MEVLFFIYEDPCAERTLVMGQQDLMLIQVVTPEIMRFKQVFQRLNPVLGPGAFFHKSECRRESYELETYFEDF